jgi:hypothetical protein
VLLRARLFASERKFRHVSTLSEVKRKFDNRFQEFRVRRTSPTTGKLVEMPILMIKRHFLMAHQAFKNRTGNRKLIPYLTETEYRFLFEGISPKQSDGVVLQDLTPWPRSFAQARSFDESL